MGRRVGEKGPTLELEGLSLTLELEGLSDRAGFESHVVTSMFLPLTKFLNHSLSFCLLISEIGYLYSPTSLVEDERR